MDRQPEHRNGVEQNAEHAAEHIHKQRVDAESLKKLCPALVALHVDYPYQKCQQTCSQTASDDGKRRCPEFFAYWHSIAEQEAGKHKDCADKEEFLHTLAVVLHLYDDKSAAETDKHVGYRRKGAEQTLRIYRKCAGLIDFERDRRTHLHGVGNRCGGVAVEMRVADNGVVNHIDNVVKREIKSVEHEQQRSVNHQYSCNNPRNKLVLHGYGDNGAGTVAECQTRHNAKDTQGGETVGGIEDALAERQGGVGAVKAVAQTAEPCDSHTDKENHDGAPHNLHQRGMGIFKLIFSHRNIGGDTHDEHKEREHKVGRSQSQPTCMLKRSIDCAP